MARRSGGNIAGVTIPKDVTNEPNAIPTKSACSSLVLERPFKNPDITVSAPAEAVLGNFPVFHITVVKTDIGNNTLTPRVMTTVEISNF